MKFIDKILLCNGNVSLNVCPENWENFTLTPDKKVRHCGICQKNVHFCDTEREIMRHANAGHCVAYSEVDTSSLPKVKPKVIYRGTPIINNDIMEERSKHWEKQEEENQQEADKLGMNIVEYKDLQDGMTWIPDNVENQLQKDIKLFELTSEKEIRRLREDLEYFENKKRMAFGSEEAYQAFLKRRAERKEIYEAAKAQHERTSLMFKLWADADIARRRCANCHAPVPEWYGNVCPICKNNQLIDREIINKNP